MCQGGLWEAGDSLGCLAETQGPGPALPGVHPPLGASGLARLGADGVLLLALHPTLQNCLRARPLSSPFSGLLRSEGWAQGGQRPPGAAG